MKKEISTSIVSRAFDTIILSVGLWLLAFLSILSYTNNLSKVSPLFYTLGGLLFASHQISPVIAIIKLARCNVAFEKKIFWISFLSLLLVVLLSYLAFYFVDSTQALTIFYGLGIVIFCLGLHHISMQHYGILLLLGLKDNRNSARSYLNIEKLYCHIITVILVPLAWIIKNIRWGDFHRYFFFLKVVPTEWIAALSIFLLALMIFWKIFLGSANLNKLLYLSFVGIQPLIFLFFEPLFGYIFFSMSHWIIEIYLNGKIMSFKADVSFTMKRFLIFICLALTFGFLYRTVQANHDVVWITDLTPKLIKSVNSSISGVLKVLIFAVGVWIILMHCYFSRIIYANRKVRQILAS